MSSLDFPPQSFYAKEAVFQPKAVVKSSKTSEPGCSQMTPQTSSKAVVTFAQVRAADRG